MPDPSALWAAAPAIVPLPGAGQHWLLTPLCDTTGARDLAGLPREVREAFWPALAALTRGLPGYAWAVNPGEVVVHVVVGGKATFRFNNPPMESR